MVPSEAEVWEMIAMTVCDRGPVNCGKTRTVAEHEQPGQKQNLVSVHCYWIFLEAT